MSIERWEPFKDIVTLREAMDRLFEDSFVRPGRRERLAEARLPIDAYLTDNELVVIATVPSLNPDDVEVTIEGDILTIKGEVKPPIENVKYLLQERPYGPFYRSLTINIPVQADKAEASFANGVLTLTVPKAEEIKPKTIKVKAR